MSIAPEIRSALLERAREPTDARTASGTRPWRRRVTGAALVACAMLVVGVVVARIPFDDETPSRERMHAGPGGFSWEATFATSRRLTKRPAPAMGLATDRLSHDQLNAVAAEIEADVPYPPGRRDGKDWSSTPADRQDMGSIGSRIDLRRLIEYRAACLWKWYWLDAIGIDDARAARNAARILSDVPQWPTYREGSSGAARRDAAAARRGDVHAVRYDAEINCAPLR